VAAHLIATRSRIPPSNHVCEWRFGDSMASVPLPSRRQHSLLVLPGVTGVLRQMLEFQQRRIAKADQGVYQMSDCGHSA
jgi:hypothetical protein